MVRSASGKEDMRSFTITAVKNNNGVELELINTNTYIQFANL